MQYPPGVGRHRRPSPAHAGEAVNACACQPPSEARASSCVVKVELLKCSCSLARWCTRVAGIEQRGARSLQQAAVAARQNRPTLRSRQLVSALSCTLQRGWATRGKNEVSRQRQPEIFLGVDCAQWPRLALSPSHRLALLQELPLGSAGTQNPLSTTAPFPRGFAGDSERWPSVRGPERASAAFCIARATHEASEVARRPAPPPRLLPRCRTVERAGRKKETFPGGEVERIFGAPRDKGVAWRPRRKRRVFVEACEIAAVPRALEGCRRRETFASLQALALSRRHTPRAHLSLRERTRARQRIVAEVDAGSSSMRPLAMVPDPTAPSTVQTPPFRSERASLKRNRRGADPHCTTENHARLMYQ
ncbi:hypothetical protein DMC30DRAFT_172727 [Rhodotorula diobovata]|uniref:Uncharacterized protein n=1 Tax=Rhodotorula diobovata TaxID=5288 RepID=A0A5C5G239_9BASI|nr:hypothetical protein DMC30DRAFT_172727 [Rhodotorula diobovata]